MSLGSRGTKWAYLIYGALSLLVVGALAWTTIASLRLERSQRLADRRRECEHRIRLAMYQMENWANPMLFSEFQRGYADYAPFSLPNAELVRLATGEMLAPGSIVEPSPLFMRPPRQEWILLHFQASLRGGYRSPQVIPDAARRWPEFEHAYDTWDREPFATTLAGLQYAYTVDELINTYDQARMGALPTPQGAEASPRLASGQPASATTDASNAPPAQQSEYTRRRINAAMIQQAQSPEEACTPQQLAVANIHAPANAADTLEANAGASSDIEVGIVYEKMLPVWLKIAHRPAPDLAFLRAVYTDVETGDTALQGFLIDWPKFRDELLAKAAHLFPDATIEVIDHAPTPTDETVFSLIPARLVASPAKPAVAPAGWNTTHSFLAIGWSASLILLGALGWGIRSLVKLSERRSQFAYAVTHELRTPLTTFRLYTDMLAQGMVAEQDRQEYLDTLNTESRRLADLVSGVLEYSRVESDSVPINKEAVSVSEILEAVRETYGPRCASAGVTLRIDGANAEEDTLLTDRQHAVQIIGNLVDNACKYGRSDADSSVSLTTQQADGMYHFDVTDHGPGIPPPWRARIFKPYERGDANSNSATGGIGLGLALSRSWARLLGGHLELLPSPRGTSGARFRLTLPASKL